MWIIFWINLFIKKVTGTAALDACCFFSSSIPFFASSSQVSTNNSCSIVGEVSFLKNKGSSITPGDARIFDRKSFRIWCGGGESVQVVVGEQVSLASGWLAVVVFSTDLPCFVIRRASHNFLTSSRKLLATFRSGRGGLF